MSDVDNVQSGCWSSNNNQPVQKTTVWTSCRMCRELVPRVCHVEEPKSDRADWMIGPIMRRFWTLKQRNRLVPLSSAVSSAVLSCLFTTWMRWKGTVSVSIIPIGIPHVYISPVSLLSFDLCATYIYSYVVCQTFLLVIPTSCSAY